MEGSSSGFHVVLQFVQDAAQNIKRSHARHTFSSLVLLGHRPAHITQSTFLISSEAAARVR